MVTSEYLSAYTWQTFTKQGQVNFGCGFTQLTKLEQENMPLVQLSQTKRVMVVGRTIAVNYNLAKPVV